MEKRAIVSLSVLCLLFTIALVAAAPPKKGEYVPGELTLTFNEDVTPEQANWTIKQFGGMIKWKDNSVQVSGTPLKGVILFPKGEEQKWIAILTKQKFVESVDYNLVSTQPETNTTNEQPNQPTCPQITPPAPGFCTGGELATENDENGCAKAPKCMKTLSNGQKAEVKIMPATASEKAIAQLGDLGFTVELKEVGNNDQAKPAYQLTAQKQAKILGIFKKQAHVTATVDAQTGQLLEAKKPWWAFLASGI